MANVILIDGNNWNDLLPITYTRPVSECFCGILTIREKWAQMMQMPVSSASRDFLKGMFPTNLGSDNFIINSSLLPEDRLVRKIRSLKSGQSLVQGELFLATRLGKKDTESFIQEYPGMTAKGMGYEQEISIISYPEDLIRYNGLEIQNDILTLQLPKAKIRQSDSSHFIGQDIYIDNAEVSHSILDSRSGPIFLDKGSKVLEGSLIKGPFYLGPGGVVKMGAKIYGATSAGRNCKLGGEIKNSILFGNTNKSHDGYLGDSLVGEWCNFGAGSSVSNMKNTYGQIRLWHCTESAFRPSSIPQCGLIMGDHSKCAINTSFNTGTVVGVFCNLFNFQPSGFVPSFSWGPDKRYQKEKVFSVCERVMNRKDLRPSDELKGVLTYLYANSDYDR